MGVVVARFWAYSPIEGCGTVVADDNGSIIAYGEGGDLAQWYPSAVFAVNPNNREFFALDLANDVIKRVDVDSGSTISQFDFTAYPEVFTADPNPRVLSRDKNLLCSGTSSDILYVIDTEPDSGFWGDFYRWSLTSGSGWNIYDLKMSFDQQYLYIAGTDSRLYKLDLTNLAEYADSGSLAAACEWVTEPLPHLIRTIGLSPSGSSDLALSYGSNDVNIGIARIDDSDGTIRWTSQYYGFFGATPRWELNRVYFANGSDSPSVGNNEASYLNGNSGSWDSAPEIKNHDTTPSKVSYALPSHDSDVIFHLGYTGANDARVWAVNVEPYIRRMFIDNDNNANIDAMGDPTGFYHARYVIEDAWEPNWSDPGSGSNPPPGENTYGYYVPDFTVTNPGTGNQLNIAWSGSVASTGSLDMMAPIKGFRLYRKPTNTIGGPYDPTARLIASYAGSQSASGMFQDTNVYNHQPYYYAGFYLYDTAQAVEGSTMYEAPYGPLYMGTGSGVPTDIVPPDMVSGFVTTAQDVVAGPDPHSGEGVVRLAWTNPTGSYFTGAVIFRQRVSPNTTVTFESPVDGTYYVRGYVVGDSTVIYSRANLKEGASVVYRDTDLSPRYQYHYAVYTHDRNFFYASGSVASPGIL